MHNLLKNLRQCSGSLAHTSALHAPPCLLPTRLPCCHGYTTAKCIPIVMRYTKPPGIVYRVHGAKQMVQMLQADVQPYHANICNQHQRSENPQLNPPILRSTFPSLSPCPWHPLAASGRPGLHHFSRSRKKLWDLDRASSSSWAWNHLQ